MIGAEFREVTGNLSGSDWERISDVSMGLGRKRVALPGPEAQVLTKK
jgi:hypothetical protein